MTQVQWIELAVASSLALFAGLMAAVETALSMISKSRAEGMFEGHGRAADRVKLIAEDPAPSINAVMFVRMLCEVAAIAVVSLVVFTNLTTTWGRISTVVGIMFVVSFIVWGVGPRTLGRQYPEPVMKSFAPLVSLLTTLFGSIAGLLVLIGNALTPGKGFADGPFASEAELRDLVDIAQAADVIEAGESRMIHSVFELGDTLVKEVMVPRPDMVFTHRDRTLRQLLSLALRSGFSRIPVVGDGIDDVLGVIYLKDVAKRIYDFPDAERLETVADLMRPATFVPDSKPAAELLRDMQLRHSHVVVVIDEFGGTAGLATIEDIIEEIVGEIVDEYDHETESVVEVEPGLYRVSSRMALDDLGDLFGLDLDDEDVETVGGMMAKLLNVVPIPGSRVTFAGIEMTADRAVGRRHQIGTVLVRQVPDKPKDAEEQDDD